jgi:hypothetical protein
MRYRLLECAGVEVDMRWWLWLSVGAIGCEGTCPDPEDCDEDGVAAAVDCDDQDAGKGPGDDWYPDCDGDGVAAAAPTVSCEQPAATEAGCLEDQVVTWRGVDERHDDCDDTNPAASAEADWYGDCDSDGVSGESVVRSCGAPADCDGVPAAFTDVPPIALDCDDNNPDATVEATWYGDCDDDGVAGDVQLTSCGEPALPPCVDDGVWFDAPPPAVDCDDDDPTVTAVVSWYADCDEDGVAADVTEDACGEPALPPCGSDGAWRDAPPPTFDCDDTDAAAIAVTTWYVDCDFDTVATDEGSTDSCGAPAAPACGGAWTDQPPATFDCADDDLAVRPGAVDPFGDTLDTNCDGEDGRVAGANDLYVSSSGDDTTGTGTRARPFETVARAAQDAGPGDVIRVGAGTFNTSFTTSASIWGGYSSSWVHAPSSNRTVIGAFSGTGARLSLDGSHGGLVEVVGVEIWNQGRSALRVTGPAGGGGRFGFVDSIVQGWAQLDDVSGYLADCEISDSVGTPFFATSSVGEWRIERCFFGTHPTETGASSLRFRGTSPVVMVDSTVFQGPLGIDVETAPVRVERVDIQASVATISSMGGTVQVFDSVLKGGQYGIWGQSSTATDVVRSWVEAKFWTPGGSVGILGNGGPIRVASSFVRAGESATGETSFGIRTIGGDLTVANSWIAGGFGPTTRAIRAESAGVRLVNTLLDPNDTVNGVTNSMVLSGNTPSRWFLEDVLVHSADDGFVSLDSFGSVTNEADFTGCSAWNPQCVVARNVTVGAHGITGDRDSTLGLSPTSPAIDAGQDPLPLDLMPDEWLATDYNGVPRPNGSAWDIGPIEAP